MALGLLVKAIEKVTGFVSSISSDHSYIHRGKGFVVPGITASITPGATYKFRFKTPDPDNPTVDKDRHFIHWRPAHVDSIATGVTYELYEAPTASGGSEVTPENLNRNCVFESQMNGFYAGATVSGGTLVQILGGGTGTAGAGNTGGGGGAELERVLKPNTEYAIVLTNRSGSTATLISYEFYWYEEERCLG